MRNKKRNRIFLLLILLLGISIGFAVLATTLKINGSASITKNRWDVHWANVGNIEKKDTVTVTTPASIDSNDNTKVDFEVTLNKPGDYYEFQVDAVNGGTLDAMVDIVSVIINGDEEEELPPYIKYTMTYADDEEIERYHLLAKGDSSTTPITPTSERIKVRIEFLRTITNEQLEEMGDDDSYDIEINVPYVQADDNAKDRHSMPTIETCPGCVYAYYTDTKYYNAADRSILDNYVEDYTQLKDGNNQQREYFIGHILDDENKIVRAFACGIKDYGLPTEKAFCIEGALNDNAGGNSQTRAQMFTRNQQLLESNELWGNAGCSDDNVDIRCPGTVVARAHTTGTVEISNSSDADYCYIHQSGILYCYEYN